MVRLVPLLMNELPTQHKILIVGNFNLDQMLPENFNLSQPSQHSTYLHGGLLDHVCDTPNSKLFLLYRHPTVITLSFFSKSDHDIYIEFSFQQFSFQFSLHNLLILMLISYFLSLMKELVKIFGENNYQSKVILSFSLGNVITVKIQKQFISEKLASLNLAPS